ncbi:LexA family protein [Alkanindiges illinoisensis]|uniref:Helix-turn-helix domain-containing protein n=1 Tax=Alkanindiges illinoisensis TaxID=197183 RepID=A0A4Y7X8S7_9GAMM|nr:XRE family transcriptional regulator [Alkanindiges illinoisensis]TEU23347.1 helix-turn-helix domain-containing protein [Alkanindiges illinoisensis]
MENQTVGQRIRALRKEKKLTQAQLAKIADVSAPAVTEWEKDGYLPKAAPLKAIADHFGVTTDYILYGGIRPKSQQQFQSGQSPDQWNSKAFLPPTGTELIDMPPASMPVISWVQAGDWTPVMASDLSNIIEWLPYDPRAGKNGFGLIVKGVSMEPMFKPDDRIYVNPTFQIDELNTGDLVVMACDGDCEATFKELVVESGRYYLRALNPNWHEKIMPVDHNCRLVGKVVGRYTIF